MAGHFVRRQEDKKEGTRVKKKNFIVSSILFLVLLFSMMTASAEGKQDVRISTLR